MVVKYPSQFYVTVLSGSCCKHCYIEKCDLFKCALPHTFEQSECPCTSTSVPRYNDSFPAAPTSLKQHTDRLSADGTKNPKEINQTEEYVFGSIQVATTCSWWVLRGPGLLILL